MTWRSPARGRSIALNLIPAALVLIFSAAPSAAATVTLTWAPNPEPDLAGYVVFYGTASGLYAGNVDVGNATSFQFLEPDPSVRYYFAVSAYNDAGMRSELSTEVHTDTTPSLTLTAMTANMPAPQGAGTSITFTAATMSTAVAQFKWLVSDGATWQTHQDWSASNVFVWTPAIANINYTVGVWTRTATSTINVPDPSLSAYMPFPIVTPLTLTSLSSSVVPPQQTGTSILFTASASGGLAPYQFKWLISNGTTWTIAQPWSASNTFTWTPSVANSNYKVGLWVRSATNTLDAPENSNAGTTLGFAITGTTQIALTGLTANRPAPQAAGSKIQFTATASGVSNPRFKWWVFDGSTWAVAQEWAGSNKFMWAPTAANPNYQVLVRVRDAASLAESDGAAMPFPIVAAAGKGNGNGK